MSHFRIALSCLVIISLAGSGCSRRLSGPLHGADGPPWIADGLRFGAEVEIEDFELRHRVLLIGDTGYFVQDDPTLEALDRWATEVDSSSVLFLGDNLYEKGLTSDDRERGEKVLSQLLMATDVSKIFIPGNHDWGLLPMDQNSEAILNQQSFVDGWSDGWAEFIPKDGCMGPTTRILQEGAQDRESIVFIALDPTPWINERLRNDCPTPYSQSDFLEALDRELAQHADDFVIVGSHYPMLTGGPHGGLSYGFFTDMIIRPVSWIVGGLADTYEPKYADWIARTQEVMRRNPPEIYAAGHDHSLQLLESGDVAGLYIVSGAGALEHVSTVTDLPESIFAHAAPGFVVVDIGSAQGQELAIVRVIEPNLPDTVFDMPLLSTKPRK